jgi:uncharacterized protein YbjT (DUF2867 family)
MASADAKPVGQLPYIIIGASGFIGKATVNALAATVGGNRINVITRDPTSAAASLYAALGASITKGDLSNVEKLKPLLLDCAGLYIITPGTEVGMSHLN